MIINTFLIQGNKPNKSIKNKIALGLTQAKGGTLQKVAQMFDSTENRNLITDKEITNKLIENIYKYTPDFLDQISEISENFYQGSVGNVHCALLKSGNRIAIKSLRKDIQQKLENDLSNVNNIIGLSSKYISSHKFSNLDQFANQFISSIESECNLLNEIENYEKIEKLFLDFELIKIPRLYKEHSNDKFIVLEWIDQNTDINDMSNLSKRDREGIQKELCDFFYMFPIKHGITQEDSNLSNFIFSNNKLYLIDFGKIVFIPLKMRIALVKILEGLVNKRTYSQQYLYRQMGFRAELLIPLDHSLTDISKILFEPLLSKSGFNFSKWEPSKKIDTVAHHNKWNLRSAAPIEYFSLTRSFFGFLKVSKILAAKIETYDLTLKILEFYKEDLKNYRIEEKEEVSYSLLNIKVIRAGIEKVNLKLPYETIYELKELITDEVKEKLKSRNLNIDDLIEEAIASRSNKIFSLKEDDDIFEVSLIKT